MSIITDNGLSLVVPVLYIYWAVIVWFVVGFSCAVISFLEGNKLDGRTFNIIVLKWPTYLLFRYKFWLFNKENKDDPNAEFWVSSFEKAPETFTVDTTIADKAFNIVKQFEELPKDAQEKIISKIEEDYKGCAGKAELISLVKEVKSLLLLLQK